MKGAGESLKQGKINILQRQEKMLPPQTGTGSYEKKQAENMLFQKSFQREKASHILVVRNQNGFESHYIRL